MLDKKSYDLLSCLLTLPEPETVTTISKVLNQSRRRIYYHLDKINDALPEEIEKIIPYPRSESFSMMNSAKRVVP